MTIIHRRIIYAIFIFIFLASAPIIILRVSGYRFNFTKRDWQKTGMLFLESKPNEVTVYLNNQLVGTKTALRIKDLAPNKYSLRLEKDGWQKWEKEIQITEGQTNTIQYVRLFKEQAQPQLLAEGELGLTALGQNKEQLAALKKTSEREEKIILFNLSNGSWQELATAGVNKVKKIQFIDNDARLAIYEADNLRLISLNNPAIQNDLAGQLPAGVKIENIKLNPVNSNEAYYVRDGGLYQYDWFLKTEKLLLETAPLDYLVAGEKIYFLNNESLDSAVLRVGPKNTPNDSEIIAFLPNQNYILAESNEQFLTIQNQRRDEIRVVNLSDKSSETLKGANYYQWAESGTEIIFGNDYELWVYRPLEKNNRYVLFTRVSNPITAVAWYAVESHLIYAENSGIKILENLANDGLSFDAGQATQVKNLFVSKKGDKIFLIGTVGQTAGLYASTIQ